MGKEYESQEKEIQMDLNLVKKCSTALIKEMQIKTNCATNFQLSDWQRSKSLITHCVGENVGNRHSFTLLMGVYIGTNFMKNDLSVLIKTGMLVPVNLIIPPFRIYLTCVLKHVKVMHIE